MREIPLARQVVEAIGRVLPPDATADTLVFTGPGGAWHTPRGSRTVLTRGNFERTYHRAIARLTDPAATPCVPPPRGPPRPYAPTGRRPSPS